MAFTLRLTAALEAPNDGSEGARRRTAWHDGGSRPGWRRAGEHDDAMQVVRHHDKGIEHHPGHVVREIFPCGGNDFTNWSEPAFCIDDIGKEAILLVRADRYEVCIVFSLALTITLRSGY